MQKFIVSVIVALVVLCGVSFYVYKTNDVNETYENKETKEVNNNMLSMMLETSAGSGEYQQTTASSWPTEGYTFNETLSKCEQGSSLSWDNDEKQVKFDGNTKDECYVYFDVYKEPTIITDVCKSNDNLSNCIKNLYVSQGKNNLYLHDSSLTNGAGDNSYRYAGSSDTTNNFVCFGYDSKDGSCPTDYLYRIIGVFDNQVKLVKWDYGLITELGTDGNYYNSYSGVLWSSNEYIGSNDTYKIGIYLWNHTDISSNTSMWVESRLNTVNLNTNFLNNMGTSWSAKIATNKWKSGGNAWSNMGSVVASVAYTNEITSPAENTTNDAKIGLMYVSDYGYSAAPSAWTTPLSNNKGYDYRLSSITSVNWMYMGLAEWLISNDTSSYDLVFGINSYGNIDLKWTSGSRAKYYAVRPCFYLNPDVTYISGNDTKNSPYIIK